MQLKRKYAQKFPLSLLILFFCLQVRVCTAEDNQLSTLVDRALKSWKVPGAAVAIVHRDKLLYLAGHGLKHLDEVDKFTPDTLFPLASCTKAFTTTAMAMLVEKGKMKWDDPVRKHVKFFRLSDPIADRLVTLRDLVSHRTGIGGHDYLWYHSPWKPEEVIRRIGKVKPDFPIRARFKYQTTMFTTAGFAVASASGQSWESFIQERIFKPLGMKSSSCSTAKLDSVKDRATGHVPNARGALVPQKKWYPLREPDAAGSINSTARDLVPWIRFQLSQGGQLLKETHTPQMVIRLGEHERRLHPDTVQMSYGMAWVIQDYRGHKLVSHAGAIDGFKAHITLVPKSQLGMVILANRHQTRMNLALSYTLVDHILGLKKKRDWNRALLKVMEQKRQASKGAIQKRIKERQFGTKPSRPLLAFVGEYEHPAYGVCRIMLKKGQLYWRWSTFSERLVHFHFDTFVVENEVMGRVELSFSKDRDGRVTGCHVSKPLNVRFTRP